MQDPESESEEEQESGSDKDSDFDSDGNFVGDKVSYNITSGTHGYYKFKIKFKKLSLITSLIF